MIKQIIDSSIADISKAKILLVDDDKLNTAILRKSLELFDHVYSVHSGDEAIKFCRTTPPDLILLDVLMPGLNGYATCKILRKLDSMEDCPIIFSTSLTGIQDEVKCWEAGGTDFVSKPVSPLTLLMRVQSHIRLKLQNDEHKSLAVFDNLTGLRNRRFFDDYYHQQVNLSQRDNNDLALVVLGIDDFKNYNSYYGYPEGDLCLKLVSKTIAELLYRPSDVAVRYSGEEFVLVLPNTDINGAKFIANKIIKQFEIQAIPHDQSHLGIVTVSVGIASLATSKVGDDIFNLAAQHLFSVKKASRNVCA